MSTAIVPTVGQAYKFTFDSKYSKCNGIYLVSKLMTYDEYLADGNDIKQDFYDACELGDDDIAKDLPQLRTTTIVEVSPPDDTTQIRITHFPLCFVMETPDHNINRYHKFGLITYCGMTDSIDKFAFIKENIKDMLTACLGIDPKPYWIDLGYQWLTESDFNEQQQQQQAASVKIINYFTENQRLQREYNAINTKFNGYEEIIINQQKQIEELTSTIKDLEAQLAQQGKGDA